MLEFDQIVLFASIRSLELETHIWFWLSFSSAILEGPDVIRWKKWSWIRVTCWGSQQIDVCAILFIWSSRKQVEVHSLIFFVKIPSLLDQLSPFRPSLPPSFLSSRTLFTVDTNATKLPCSSYSYTTQGHSYTSLRSNLYPRRATRP